MKKIQFLFPISLLMFLFSINSQAQTEIKDADGNTTVETARTGNDNIIIFQTGGTDAFQIVKNRLVPIGSGNSLFIGDLAGDNDDGTNNGAVFIGSETGRNNTSGVNNTGIGSSALFSNTIGNANVGIGANALFSNLSGVNNAAIGVNALRANISGNSNSAIGVNTLFSNTTGNSNSAIGVSALNSNTTGSSNTGIGANALFSNLSGANNIGIGTNALRANIDGNENAAIGSLALFSNLSGASNSAIGSSALRANTTGSNNSAMGGSSLLSNTVGSTNIAIGLNSLLRNINGNNNVSIGANSNAFNTDGSNNTMIGVEAGRGTVAGGRSGNIFIGYKAGFSDNGSNKLYIENSNDVTTPLIYGDFATNQMGIGTSSLPTDVSYTLAVEGKIITEEVRVLLRGSSLWPDYVFKSNYRLKSLEEVNEYIKENGHLPNIPSASVVEKEGVALGEMDKKLLEKIEELTLYMIEINEEVKTLKLANEKMKNELNKLKN